ncbi:MAG TPA: efflux RND transporter permease subunit [Stellaceae bacterium]|nr:efflux RND transporter permease subunit [Stellaceae bacterium]
MSFSEIFIRRPVATTLLTLGVALSGIGAFFLLPVSPLPQVDTPTIAVTAQLPGASPETMANSVATPLERHLGQIADVAEMTSSSTVGQSSIVLQFGLDRDIDGAARDVQAAINAARADLPTALKSNPTYRKVNPADSPILIVALTSPTLTPGQLYDSAATVLQQKLSQVQGIGQVTIGGSSLPAVRVELDPYSLAKYGIGLEDVRAALASANANSPKGAIEEGGRHYQIYTNDQARQAAQYRALIVAYRNGSAVRLSDVGTVEDSVEDLRNEGLADNKPAVILILYRQPGANIIDAVERVKAALPELKASIPSDIDFVLTSDRTPVIRASLRDVERALLISIALVILVVVLFLRDPRAALIPSVAVPVSLIGTFGVMYLLNYSLDNLSLMALAVATGFVVDDAIVVLENITRHVEAGMGRFAAAIQGAREVGFTVISMSVSLIAVFLPVLLMGGIVGRFFREFAVTLSVAVAVSLVVSLTTTPMMCAYLVTKRGRHPPGRLSRLLEHGFEAMIRVYDRSLSWALSHSRSMVALLFVVLGLNIYLFNIVPKGFFPQQDSGRISGGLQGDQSISFQAMRLKLEQFMAIVKADPDVESLVGFTGGRQTNSGLLFGTLRPLADREATTDQVINRLRPKLARVAGAALYLQASQDVRTGGRYGNAQYQYTLEADDLPDLELWGPKITEALRHEPTLTDVNSDQQQNGLESDLVIDRATSARLNLTAAQIDNTLYDAFGQRQVSTIYNPLNQYHVVMEVAPRFWQNPEILKDIYVSTAGGVVGGTHSTNAAAGTTSATSHAKVSASAAAANANTIASDTARNAALNQLANTGRGIASTGAAVTTSAETMVPLAAVAHFGPGNTPLAVSHQGPFVAATIAFNLAPGKSLSDAVGVIGRVMNELGVPASIHGSFSGTAAAFQQSLQNEPLLILAALVTIYLVLGMLYESYIHPLTILSTLPSAGFGAVLALMLFNTEFSIIALIGVFLLIGIVKKNAIMMIDLAIEEVRVHGTSAREAIHYAALRRFRPILMTTMAALFGAVPLALGTGDGAELRQPLGISIVGGLIVSQALTLYTTPVIYLYLDRLRIRRKRAPLFVPEAGE